MVPLPGTLNGAIVCMPLNAPSGSRKAMQESRLRVELVHAPSPRRVADARSLGSRTLPLSVSEHRREGVWASEAGCDPERLLRGRKNTANLWLDRVVHERLKPTRAGEPAYPLRDLVNEA
jgi:hypothetical protein